MSWQFKLNGYGTCYRGVPWPGSEKMKQKCDVKVKKSKSKLKNLAPCVLHDLVFRVLLSMFHAAKWLRNLSRMVFRCRPGTWP